MDKQAAFAANFSQGKGLRREDYENSHSDTLGYFTADDEKEEASDEEELAQENGNDSDGSNDEECNDNNYNNYNNSAPRTGGKELRLPVAGKELRLAARVGKKELLRVQQRQQRQLQQKLPVKRKPGRPRKQPAQDAVQPKIPPVAQTDLAIQPVKRKRGRPRKHPLPTAVTTGTNTSRKALAEKTLMASNNQANQQRNTYFFSPTNHKNNHTNNSHLNQFDEPTPPHPYDVYESPFASAPPPPDDVHRRMMAIKRPKSALAVAQQMELMKQQAAEEAYWEKHDHPTDSSFSAPEDWDEPEHHQIPRGKTLNRGKTLLRGKTLITTTTAAAEDDNEDDERQPDSAPDKPKNRKMGRPKKKRPQESNDCDYDDEDGIPKPKKRKPGRPKKQPPANGAEGMEIMAKEKETKKKRKPGRPTKKQPPQPPSSSSGDDEAEWGQEEWQPLQQQQPAKKATKRKLGRPKKVQPVDSSSDEEEWVDDKPNKNKTAKATTKRKTGHKKKAAPPQYADEKNDELDADNEKEEEWSDNFAPPKRKRSKKQPADKHYKHAELKMDQPKAKKRKLGPSSKKKPAVQREQYADDTESDHELEQPKKKAAQKPKAAKSTTQLDNVDFGSEKGHVHDGTSDSDLWEDDSKYAEGPPRLHKTLKMVPTRKPPPQPLIIPPAPAAKAKRKPGRPRKHPGPSRKQHMAELICNTTKQSKKPTSRTGYALTEASSVDDSDQDDYAAYLKKPTQHVAKVKRKLNKAAKSSLGKKASPTKAAQYRGLERHPEHEASSDSDSDLAYTGKPVRPKPVAAERKIGRPKKSPCNDLNSDSDSDIMQSSIPNATKRKHGRPPREQKEQYLLSKQFSASEADSDDPNYSEIPSQRESNHHGKRKSGKPSNRKLDTSPSELASPAATKYDCGFLEATGPRRPYAAKEPRFASKEPRFKSQQTHGGSDQKPVKRKLGRPPKKDSAEPPVKRKPGRPRKNAEDTAQPQKKRRGRPPKDPSQPKRKRGRPAKNAKQPSINLDELPPHLRIQQENRMRYFELQRQREAEERERQVQERSKQEQERLKQKQEQKQARLQENQTRQQQEYEQLQQEGSQRAPPPREPQLQQQPNRNRPLCPPHIQRMIEEEEELARKAFFAALEE